MPNKFRHNNSYFIETPVKSDATNKRVVRVIITEEESSEKCATIYPPAGNIPYYVILDAKWRVRHTAFTYGSARTYAAELLMSPLEDLDVDESIRKSKSTLDYRFKEPTSKPHKEPQFTWIKVTPRLWSLNHTVADRALTASIFVTENEAKPFNVVVRDNGRTIDEADYISAVNARNAVESTIHARLRNVPPKDDRFEQQLADAMK